MLATWGRNQIVQRGFDQVQFTAMPAFVLLAVLAPVLGCSPQELALPYDPLAAVVRQAVVQQESAASSQVELAFEDQSRARVIALRVYLPPQAGPSPVVLFSHGLGGARTNNSYLGRHWSARGYVVVFLQHAGSDEFVWKNAPIATRLETLKTAANRENLLLRAGDVAATLDQLALWHDQEGHALHGRLDLARVGMSGHSFGAVTTQSVSGQKQALGKSLTEARIRAAVAMSPSVPRGASAESLFGEVRIPWMLLTGTKDRSIVGRADPESRLDVYPALPPGGKYELVLEGAEHSAFGDRALPGDSEPRNPNHQRAILALTTAFWDATLREDPAARAWLDGQGARAVLEEKDRWQHK